MASDIEFSDSDAAESPCFAEEAAPPPVTPEKSKADGMGRPCPKSSSKQAGDKRHMARKEKGKRGCRCCGRNLDTTAFQINQVNCLECKRGLDVISKKALQQGRKEWFKEQKSDPKKLRAMMTNYLKAVSEATALGNKRTTWNLAVYVEQVEAESRTDTTDRGKLMWEEEAVIHWMSVAGGSHSKEQALSLIHI